MDFWTEWLFWVFAAVAFVASVTCWLALKLERKNADLVKSSEPLPFPNYTPALVLAAAISIVLAFIFVTWQGGLVAMGFAIAGYVIGERISGGKPDNH